MVRTLCFYLPQYHPIPENDAWWGRGFTEWRNVAKAVPNYVGHYQPRIPSELGFYDLRLVDVQVQQAALAREYGVHGFCYYFYWFNGRRVLERPLDQHLAHPEIDLPFCVCWANENWTRTWDGKADHVLLAQRHSPEDDEAFLRALLPYFRDPRYIRVDGKPLLAVYRVDLFPDARRTAERWRTVARAEGIGELHLCAVQFYGIEDPRPWGFDAAIEFPPHQFLGAENRPDAMPEMLNEGFAGWIADYQKIAAQALRKPEPDFLMYRGVVPSWDNTARRQDTSCMLINASPHDYQFWLRRVVEQTRRSTRRSDDERIVFVNAWNEWGEGCHLEPDARHGRAWLEATRSAVVGESPIEELLAGLAILRDEAGGAADELREAFAARQRALIALQDLVRQKNAEIDDLREQLEARVPPVTLGTVARQELSKRPRLKAALKRLLAKP